MLIPGRDFEEYCTGNHPANQIRIFYSAKKGDVWSIYILPTNALIAAVQAADTAELAAQNADFAATNALEAKKSVQELANQTLTDGVANLNAIRTQGAQAVKNVGIARDNALDEIRDITGKVRADCVNVWQVATGEIKKEAETSSQAARNLWQQAQADIAEARIDALQKAQAAGNQAGLKAAAAAESAGNALDLARCAWRAAFNVAVDNAKPGLASVTKLADLLAVASGVYIINPLIVTKTPFMGVWPVEKIEDAKWDGFFFIGVPYPDKPVNPLDPDDPLSPEIPPYPQDPSTQPDMQPPASGSQWLPCDHTHNQEQ